MHACLRFLLVVDLDSSEADVIKRGFLLGGRSASKMRDLQSAIALHQLSDRLFQDAGSCTDNAKTITEQEQDDDQRIVRVVQ